MKPHQICAFIFAVIALLACLAGTFPEKGIEINESQSLRFPTLNSILTDTDDDGSVVLSPEELIARRALEMRAAEEDAFLSFIEENPARICFPNDDYTYFDPLYAALDSAKVKKMHIVHYGDSQIEEDRISSTLRTRLQKEFTGAGVGLLSPQQGAYSMTTGIALSEPQSKNCAWGNKSLRLLDDSRLYGPLCQVTQIDSSVAITLFPRRVKSELTSAQLFNQITLLTGPDADFVASIRGRKVEIGAGKRNLRFTTISVPDSTSRANLSLSGSGSLYGVMLEHKTGVYVDNIPLRGCSGTQFTLIDGNQLSTFFSKTNTQLIILEFGGNAMPYLKTDKQVNNYLTNLERQITYLKRIAPKALILFIGPSDMSTKINGKMVTYPILPEFEQRLCRMVNSHDCAYWSMFNAMGGKGSMVQWVKAQPALAGSDYVHFTQRGAAEVGKMLSQSIMLGYKYYKWREKDRQVSQPIEMKVDTIPVLPVKQKKVRF